MAENWKISITNPSVGEEEARAVADVVRSGWLSAGPNLAEFEKEFARRSGTKDAVALCNGTAALHAMLVASGIGPGDEVIVPGITFISTATSVVHAGATPVFADVDAATLNMRPQAIEPLVTKRTKAVMPVHYAGQSADMDEILDVGRRLGLTVFEDAAQAHGASYRGRQVGSLGRAAMFSFTPNKNITTGEGAMVTTSDEGIADRLRMLRNHGSRGTYPYEMIGYNFRMTEIQAAVGRVQLGKLTAILARKKALAERLASRLKNIPGIGLPTWREDRSQCHQLFTLRIRNEAGVSRDEMMERLGRDSIQTRIYFPPCYTQPPLRRYLLPDQVLPNCDALAGEIMTLPLHARLTDDDADFMADRVTKIVAKTRR